MAYGVVHFVAARWWWLVYIYIWLKWVFIRSLRALSTHLRRQKKQMLPGQKSMCISAYNRGMGRRVWPQCKGWRKSSATRRSSKTSRKSCAAMAMLCMTRSLARLSNSRVISARTFLTSSFMLALLGRTRSRFMVFNPLPLATTFLLLWN